MSLTTAIEQAYAANPAGEMIWETLELDHVTFDTPIRIVCNAKDDISLPPVLGETAVTFTAIGVSVTMPGADDDGPTPMKLRLDLVSQTLLPYLRDATASTTPITVTYRAYTSTDLTRPGEVVSGLELRVASLSATAAEATVSWREVGTQAFPLATYDEEYYPALVND